MDDEKLEKIKFENLDTRYTDLEYMTIQIIIFVFREATIKWKIDEAVNNFIDLTYIIDGEAIYTINDKDYKVTKGDLICIPKNSKRKAKSDPYNLMKSYAINFFAFNFDGEHIELPIPLISKIEKDNYLIKLYEELNQEWIQKKNGHLLKCRAITMLIIHEILSQLYYDDSLHYIDPRIKKITNYICENYKHKITVNSLAEQVGLNPVYLGILFKNNMEISLKRYINQIRINNAENLILSEGYSLSEVAEKCGFDDVFYFSKVYKEIKGYSPSNTKFNLRGDL